MPQSGFFMNLYKANAIRPASTAKKLIKLFYRITMTDVFQQYSSSVDQSSTVLSHWRWRLAGVGSET